MTTPTISTSASMVTPLSVKSSSHMKPKVAIVEAGIATLAISVERQLPMNASATTSDARIAPSTRCSVISCSAAWDVRRLVADHLRRTPGKLRLHLLHGALDGVDHLDRVGAGLWRRTSSTTVGTSSSRRAIVLCPLVPSSATDVAHADPAPRRVADHEIVEGGGVGEAADRAGCSRRSAWSRCRPASGCSGAGSRRTAVIGSPSARGRRRPRR